MATEALSIDRGRLRASCSALERGRRKNEAGEKRAASMSGQRGGETPFLVFWRQLRVSHPRRRTAMLLQFFPRCRGRVVPIHPVEWRRRRVISVAILSRSLFQVVHPDHLLRAAHSLERRPPPSLFRGSSSPTIAFAALLSHSPSSQVEAVRSLVDDLPPGTE